MSQVSHRHLIANGIRMHVAEAGHGPLVLLLHGFPESWYSWRDQLDALADGGFHAVAPDLRGYGDTDRPPAIDQYSMFHLVGDVVGLMDALETPACVVVGHDWGATVVWNTALWRPDRVRGVVGLSVPARRRRPRPPLAEFRELLGDRFFQLYYQPPGVAERDMEADVRRTLLALHYGTSGEAPTPFTGLVVDGGLAASFGSTTTRPTHLNEADLDHLVKQFESTGFSGGLNWYRNVDRNWELSAPWQGARVLPPALYMYGDRESFLSRPGNREAIAELATVAPGLVKTIVLPGCGHWTQQERPEEVNRALLGFVRKLD